MKHDGAIAGLSFSNAARDTISERNSLFERRAAAAAAATTTIEYRFHNYESLSTILPPMFSSSTKFFFSETRVRLLLSSRSIGGNGIDGHVCFNIYLRGIDRENEYIHFFLLNYN